MRRHFRRSYNGKRWILTYRLNVTDKWKELTFNTLTEAKKYWKSLKEST